MGGEERLDIAYTILTSHTGSLRHSAPVKRQ